MAMEEPEAAILAEHPLPGVLPLVALDTFAARGILAAEAVPVLREIRDHNALPFDFVLKRLLRSPASAGGNRFPAAAFETRRHVVKAT